MDEPGSGLYHSTHMFICLFVLSTALNPRLIVSLGYPFAFSIHSLAFSTLLCVLGGWPVGIEHLSFLALWLPVGFRE